MRNLLLSTVAALAITVAAPAAFADANIDGDSNDANVVSANQNATSTINNTDADVTNVTDDGNLSNRTGDVDYDNNTFNASGIYTLQNQTGMNNGGNNATNLAVQVNQDLDGDANWGTVNGDVNVELADGSKNEVKAKQELETVITGSNATVTNNNDTQDGPGDIGNTTNATGDVDYGVQTFDAEGVYTLQNQTGMNNAGNNASNFAAQVNLGGEPANLTLDNADNLVRATQDVTTRISGSDTNVNNDVFEDGVLNNRSGDVDYSGETFNAEGLYTLQNNTGANVATNNALQLGVQLNDNEDAIQMDGDSSNLVVANQTLSATITGSNATVDNNFQPSSDGDVTNRTGDVSYSTNTFDASGVYTLSNNTGMNNAGSNATNVAAQLNGPALGF